MGRVGADKRCCWLEQWCNGKQVEAGRLESPLPYMGIHSAFWFLVLSNYLDKGWKLDQWCNGKQVDKQLVEPPFPYMGIKASHVIPVL